MPTPAERRALLFLASIAFLGAGWRAVRATGVAAPSEAERAALDAQLAAVDSARSAPRGGRGTGAAGARGRGRGGSTRPAAGTPAAFPVDVDRASAEQLEMLPRIGPALARRIVADRDSLGPFGSLAALQRVRGIGPATARELARRVTFSAPEGVLPGAAARSQVVRTRRERSAEEGDRPVSQIIWGSPRPPP